MGFRFAEKMAGTVEWDAQPGVRHPLRFEIEARADSMLRHLADGKVWVRGTLHAAPLAQGVDVEGIIIIRPIGQRIIRYELAFAGYDGKRYELVGQKDIRWRSPLETFTRLPAEILDQEHRRIGTCEATFDLRHDLWSFLRSFGALRRAAHAPGAAASASASGLSA
jgi:hypothetical protein